MLRLEGASNWLLLKETILPNISAQYIREISRAFTIAILDISALGFISLGAQRPTPEWGAMIKDLYRIDLLGALGSDFASWPEWQLSPARTNQLNFYQWTL